MKQLPVLFCYFLISLSLTSSAQYYNTGQDPSALKWMKIKTERFKVIYPSTYGEAGIDFARALDNSYSKLTNLYPVRKFRIPVIIHNYTTESNGYVAWAPDRMEIYPTPEQNSIPLDPNTQLAIHELTHVLQMESLNKGFTRIMTFITGQQFTGLVSSLLPLWFLEGDAVFAESVLTGSGRGRTPSFQKQLKALIIEKGNVYKYDKIVNGSFRDFVPDYYQSGYQIMAWSYLKYNPEMWKEALSVTGKAPYLINPVNISLRRSASLTKKKLFTETYDTLKTLWTTDDKTLKSETFKILNPQKGKEYVNYYSPVSAGNDSIIAVKTSLDDPPSFVLIRPSDKSEEKIHIPGNCYPWFISFGKGKLVWVEKHTDPRWANRSWSEIRIMDIEQKRTLRLARRTRYMSASVSPDAKVIAATENTISNKNNLLILDATNGDIIHSIPAPFNASLQRPQWDASGQNLTVIYLTEKGEGVLKFNLADRMWELLIEAGTNGIQSSMIRNDSLFFVSSHSGIDNIYLQRPDKSIVPLTNSRFGVSDLNLFGSMFLFADYTSSGNNICLTELPEKLINSEIKKIESSYLIERFDPGLSNIPTFSDAVYHPQPYRKWSSLFRLHSWMPFYADMDMIREDPKAFSPGFTILSQNNISTLESSFGYEYSGRRHKFHSGIKWAGWYPVFESRLDYGNTPYVYKPKGNIDDPVNIHNGYEWTNTVILPLYFRGGSFTKQLYLSASSKLMNSYIYSESNKIYDDLQNQLTGRFYFSIYRRSAIRDIHPEWGHVFDAIYSYYPFDKEIYGDIFTALSAFYFPGLLKNHGFKLKLEAEKQRAGQFLFVNRASFSRGYLGARNFHDKEYYDNIISQQLKFASVDYFMPLAYPDLNIGGILYLTRIRTDLFFDITRGTDNSVFISTLNPMGIREIIREDHPYTEFFRSFGLQMMSDFYLFRIPFMISSGIEASWRRINEYPYIRMLFSINIFGMNIGRHNSGNRTAV